MNHLSCIKIPGTKESSVMPNLSTRETDGRDQLCTKNDLITMANEAFGANKWSHAVTSQTLDFVEYVTGKYYVGCAAFVKVQLGDGMHHEDLGYSCSDGPNKGLVIFSARTGSITNALKNTLLCFGGEMAKKIRSFIKLKTDEPHSAISTIIGDSQQIIVPKHRIAPPQAQSTPEKKQKRSPVPVDPAILKDDNQDIPPLNNNDRKQSLTHSRPVTSGAQVDIAALTDEERRLERKRRQAQKQEEYRKLLKAKECTDAPNPRF